MNASAIAMLCAAIGFLWISTIGNAPKQPISLLNASATLPVLPATAPEVTLAASTAYAPR